jgi:hypothetical protein
VKNDDGEEVHHTEEDKVGDEGVQCDKKKKKLVCQLSV